MARCKQTLRRSRSSRRISDKQPARGGTVSADRDGGETVDQKENWAGDGGGDHHVL